MIVNSSVCVCMGGGVLGYKKIFNATNCERRRLKATLGWVLKCFEK